MKKLENINEEEAQTSYFKKAVQFFRMNPKENVVKVRLRNNSSTITRFEADVYNDFLDDESRYWYALFKILEKETEKDLFQLAYRYTVYLYQIDFFKYFEEAVCDISEMESDVRVVYKHFYKVCSELKFADYKNLQNMYLLIKCTEINCERENNPEELRHFYDLVFFAKKYHKIE